MREPPERHDMKESLSSARKADTTHVRRAFQIYTARPCEYGTAKGYERGNYRRATGDATGPTGADFTRYAAYLRAARDHIDENLDAMELHRANDPKLVDVEGMKRAAYAADTDVMPGAEIGASMLPHVAPACSSLMMAITQATDCGLLPRDPGTPWVSADKHAEVLPFEVGACVRIDYVGVEGAILESRPGQWYEVLFVLDGVPSLGRFVESEMSVIERALKPGDQVIAVRGPGTAGTVTEIYTHDQSVEVDYSIRWQRSRVRLVKGTP